ncbi:hypothetical protein ARCL110784_08000 [Arcobacter cloacae]
MEKEKAKNVDYIILLSIYTISIVSSLFLLNI